MKKQLLTAAVSAAIAAGGLAVPALSTASGFSANVGMVNEYRWRGVDQSDEEFAIQGGFDYAHDSGFYAGIWASNVDFDDEYDEVNMVATDGASSEVDVYAGFGGEFDVGSGLGWDVGFIHYMYPGSESSFDYDFTEVYGGLSYWLFSGYWYISDDTFGSGGDTDYINLAVDYEFDNGVGIGASYGDYHFDDAEDYNDWKIYAAYSLPEKFGGFDLELSYVDTDIDGNNSKTDDQWLLAVSKSWE